MACNSGCGCRCSLIDNLANALNNLFPTSCNRCGSVRVGCNGNGNGNTGCGCNGGNNGGNTGCGCNGGNTGCGCNGNGGGNGTANILNNPLLVNLFGTGSPSCGCNGGNNGGSGCGCGSNANLSAYTACGNQCYDDYYARQYALFPYNQPTVRCCCN